MKRTVVVLLFACGLAVAAPVPKTSPKLEDVFGEVIDKKSECKFEMGKGGALTITVPTKTPVMELTGGLPVPPLVGRRVEGDFAVTIRVTHVPPKDAGRANSASMSAAIWAGVSLAPVGTKDTTLTFTTVHADNNGTWKSGNRALYRREGATSATDGGGVELRVTPVYLRMTRKGGSVHLEQSEDGDKWQQFTTVTFDDPPEAVTVGPVLLHNTSADCQATFDQYEVKPLKEEKK